LSKELTENERLTRLRWIEAKFLTKCKGCHYSVYLGDEFDYEMCLELNDSEIPSWCPLNRKW